MTNLNRAEAARFLLSQEAVAIVTHRRPDGDTLGSAVALCLSLRKIGKQAWILENPDVTEKYAYLLEGLTKAAPERGDTLVSVDVAAPSLLPAGIQAEALALRIDHHAGESFVPLELVDPQAAACGELIYDILQLIDLPLDREIANALYIAISTDTGCFRYANTRPHTFAVAAACAEASQDLPQLNHMLFETNSLKRLKLQGWIIDNLLLLQDGQIAICAIPLAVEKAMELTEDDMENISGFPRSVAGVKLSATLRQQEDGMIKVSVRSVPQYDARAVCAPFGGGGHRGAAGASLDMSMEDAVKAISSAMPNLE